MTPYVMHERAEVARGAAESHQVSRDEWIRDKANELAEKYPELVTDFVSWKYFSLVCSSETAQDLYAEFVDKMCLEAAEKMAKENEFLTGKFSEVA